MADDKYTAAQHEAGFFQAVGAVLWGFLGIRKRTSGERDVSTVKPQHVIAAGIIAAICLIAILATLVHFIVAK